MSAALPIVGKRILVTGVTGWVAGPVAASLASQGNTVFGAARFRNAEARTKVSDAGIEPVPVDLTADDWSSLPADLDLVLHFAVAKVDSFDVAFRVNAEGSADLMEAVVRTSPQLGSFFHCSSTAVYAPVHGSPRKETDPLGDSHRPMPGMPTYSISKIAAEVLVRHTSRRLGLPTVIARLNVPYGDTYGWMLFHLMMMEQGMAVPVHLDQPTDYTPIHADDIARSIPYLLSLASTPAATVNWGGDEVVSVEDWCAELGRLTGHSPTFAPTAATIASIVPDLTRLHDTGFRSQVGWRDGMRRMVATSRPDLLRT
ncbi:MAG TPA: NAD(P)-dependent oxidoreductase [Ilumatobacteraceae bacterium]|nr:NAD(P)-dependent oxidoreductase [Ilumatobacteraceae bacterium]